MDKSRHAGLKHSPIGRVTRWHVTPGIVSTDSGGDCCAAWKARMLSNAVSKAAFDSASSCGSGRSCDQTCGFRVRARVRARVHHPVFMLSHMLNAWVAGWSFIGSSSPAG